MDELVIAIALAIGAAIWMIKRRERKQRRRIIRLVEQELWMAAGDSFNTTVLSHRNMKVWWPNCPVNYLVWRADRYETIWRLRFGFEKEGILSFFDTSLSATKYPDRYDALTEFRKTIQLYVESSCR